MNYADLILSDTVNGSGVRISLFVSGCTLNCKGCFNKAMQNFRYGNPYTEEVEQRIIDSLKDSGISGLSLLGGDPMDSRNYPTVLSLCKRVKKEVGKTIWLWTGLLFKDIYNREIITYLDVIIDGPFIEALRDPTLQYRGSSNQNLIRLTKNA